MASPARIAANRLNSRKSTGPRTPEGQAKSSMNALKHGNRSRKLALLREESCAFEERLRKWMAIGDAQNDVEEYLVYRNVAVSFELDRAERARLERCRSLIENSDEEEAAQAEAVGKFVGDCISTPIVQASTFGIPHALRIPWGQENGQGRGRALTLVGCGGAQRREVIAHAGGINAEITAPIARRRA